MIESYKQHIIKTAKQPVQELATVNQGHINKHKESVQKQL